MNELFHWQRLGLLIRNDLVKDFRDYLIVFAVFTIIMLINAVPAAAFGHMREGFYYGVFGGLMIIGGSIVNSLAFTELNNKKENEAWLLIPASTLEKTIARYLSGTVLFTLHMLVFVTVVAFFIEGFNLLLFGRTNELFNPVSLPVLDTLAAFMVIQPIFFLGGVWFKKLRWFKTVITVFSLGMVLGIFSLIVFLFLFGGNFSEFQNVYWDFDDININFAISSYRWLDTVIKVFWYVLLPPFCCYVAWLRVSETQVSHGV